MVDLGMDKRLAPKSIVSKNDVTVTLGWQNNTCLQLYPFSIFRPEASGKKKNFFLLKNASGRNIEYEFR